MIIQLFIKGGPIMWPILILSVITFAVVIERILFLFAEKSKRQPKVVDAIFHAVEEGDLDRAAQTGAGSTDLVARTLTYGLEHRRSSLANALVQQASRELDQYSRGLTVMDTAITLGPLLGLLGTVIGMMRSFGVVTGDLAAQQQVITGGIAESLIAVAFGLGVAIVAVIPYNYLNRRVERVRRELEDASNHLELVILKNPESRIQNSE